jgi:ABC-type glycerol-3-phosphate transport system substrate-binding protein
MKRYLIGFLILLFLAGCSLFDGEQAGSEATQTAVATNPPPISTPTLQVTLQVTEPAIAPNPSSLNVWVLGEISTLADTPGGTILAEQLAAFETTHPDITLNVETKAPSGQGGTLSYLRSGRNIAPSILPDLIILPTDSLPTAASEELIYPLDEHLAADAIEDLYPAANELAEVNGSLYGYPFALSNLGHMAYSSSIFTDTVPLTWDEFLNQDDVTFAFPGAGTPGAELALQLYLASGGTIVGEGGQPTLEIEPLANALTHFSRGRELGLLPLENSGYTSLNESWQAFNRGAVNSVQTVESQYNVERFAGLDSSFSGIPGVESPLVPLVKGWAWAISTPDPARQALSAELLNWLVAGPNVGDWSLAAAKLPGRRSAFEQWPVNDPYTIFLGQELERADPYPTAASNAILSVLNTAVFDVLTQEKSPQQAAEDAVAVLQG